MITAPGLVAQEPLGDEEKETLYEALRRKYDVAGDDSAVQEARDSQGRSNLVAGIGDALGSIGRSRAAARGVSMPDVTSGMARALRGSAKDEVDAAQGDRRDKMAKVLQDADLEWKGRTQERHMADWQRSDAARAREDDPASEESKSYQTLAAKMMPGQDFSGKSATQLKTSLPTLEKLYEIDQRGKDRSDARAERNYYREQDRLRREEEKQQKLDRETEALTVSDYGVARTADDAKKLKDAVNIKADFDRKLQEMIALRNEHGVEYMDREAVARGKQLSSDLLLLYKDLANLGVLSKSDEGILKRVIPDDPLGHDWAPGQDSIMSNLKAFQDDMDADFNTTLDTRLKTKGPAAIAAKKPRIYREDQEEGEAIATPAGKQVVKKFQHKAQNKTKLIYSDGSEEVVDGLR